MSPVRKLLFAWAFLAVTHFASASTLTNLASFNGGNGAVPLARLVQAGDGNFYGTTLQGGRESYGTLFRVTPGGEMTTLFNFDVTSGGGPEGGLIEASPGTFYGTTSDTAFKFTSDGTHTTLARFFPGATAQAGLLLGSDGNLYGTTYFGGPSQAGNIFKLTPAGILTNLRDFNGANGGGPNFGGLIQASDGNIYGTTEGGGSAGYGTIFKLTPDGSLTTLINFNKMNGANPAGIMQSSDGNFYGTTKAGGPSNDGTIFQMTPDGVLTTLINFDSNNGQEPYAGLIQGSDGDFYGTTILGGLANKGTVFQLVHGTGSQFILNTLVNFDSTNGANPQGGLVQGRDGYFYGTTTAGGSSNEGTVFRFEPSAGEVTQSSALPKWARLAILGGLVLAGLIVALYLRRRVA
jgi:uncharacterized repeat protein (TIGR03803 family)